MNVPFFPYKKVRSAYPRAIKARERSEHLGHFILGPEVEEFEQKFADYIGVRHAIGLNSGTDALLLALAAAGVGPGDEVITVSHTFIATIQVIHHLGAEPILVDIDDDGLIDTNLVKEAVTENTKAIIPVHLEGNVRHLDTMPVGIPIIEDAAQAIGASWNGKKTGSYGIAGCFSFYPAKILGTLGDAGALVTNDSLLAEEVRKLRNHYLIGKQDHSFINTFSFGWNSRLDTGNAAILSEKLRSLDEDIARRHVIASMYTLAFHDLPLILPQMKEGRVFQDYVIRSDRRNELAQYLKDHGVGILGHDLLPNHLHPGLGLDHFHLPKTEEYIRTQVRIPCNHFMKDTQVEYVIKTVRKFYGM